jgi:hypothetical protein
MGMAQGLAPWDKLATAGGYTRSERCNLDCRCSIWRPLVPFRRNKNLPFGVWRAHIYCLVVSGKVFLWPLKFDHASLSNARNFSFRGHVPFI